MSQSLEQAANRTSTQPEKKSTRSLRTRLAAGVIAVGVGGGLAGCGGASAAPDREPAATSSAAVETDPEILASQMTLEQLVQSIEMSTAEYPTPEAAAEGFVRRVEDWLNAGSNTAENPTTKNYSHEAARQYAAEVGGKYDQAYTNALFGPYAEALSSTVFVQNIKQFHEDGLYWYARTSIADPENVFETSFALDNIESSETLENGDTRVILTATYSDNGSENMAGDARAEAGDGGSSYFSWRGYIDLRATDGTWQAVTIGSANELPGQ